LRSRQPREVALEIPEYPLLRETVRNAHTGARGGGWQYFPYRLHYM